MTALDQAYLIKGFLLAKEAPKPILDAIESIIEAFPLVRVTGSTDRTHLDLPDDRKASNTHDEPRPQSAEPKEPRKARTIPAEEADTVRRLVKEEKSDDEIGKELGYPVAAVKTFRKEHEISRPRGNPNYRKFPDSAVASQTAAPLFEIRKAPPSAPAPVAAPKPKPVPQIDVDRLITVHRGYAGKRDDGLLVDGDWPDIKARLAKGESTKAIAGDYEVAEEDLDFFIASSRRRENKSPGEALASPFQQTSGATQRQP